MRGPSPTRRAVQLHVNWICLIQFLSAHNRAMQMQIQAKPASFLISKQSASKLSNSSCSPF
jgi:hypothetical protein